MPERFAVRFTSTAREGYANILFDADAEKVDKVVGLLETVPYLGHRYDPVYASARLPFEVYVFYAGNMGVYYTVDEGSSVVLIEYIEDQRVNPEARFR